MAETLTRFEIFSRINETLKNKIKLFHVFNDCHNRKNVLFVTCEDRVFAFGANGWGICGFGHENAVEEPQEVEELRDKRVQSFFFGNDFALALTEDNQVFGWGANYCGQLGTGVTTEVDDRSVPVLFEFFRERTVKQISCGYFHSLVLTTDGHVFGWGWNAHGQVGCGRRGVESVPQITRLEALSELSVRAVHCSYNSSLALTADGQVFGWGDNSSRQLGHRLEHYFEPRLIQGIQNVRAICSSLTNTYFLSAEGKVFFCGEYENHARNQPVTVTCQELPKLMDIHKKSDSEERAPKRLKSEPRFTALNLIDGKTTAVTEEWVFALKGNRITKTKYKSLFDYYSIKYQLTHRTIEVRRDHRVLKVMARAFNNPKNADLKFKLKRRASDQFEHVFAHRWFLEENSEYFARMFANKWAEAGSGEVEVTGYSFEAYFEYLRWLYTATVETQDLEVLMEMLAIAEVYLDKDFKDKCVTHVKALTDLRNVCSVYSFAVELRAKSLEDFCFTIIADNVRHIITTEDYQLMDSSVAKHFFTEYFKHN